MLHLLENIPLEATTSSICDLLFTLLDHEAYVRYVFNDCQDVFPINWIFVSKLTLQPYKYKRDSNRIIHFLGYYMRDCPALA